MKSHPILFSTPMVQAILAGRKTQTRRIVKPQPYQMEDGWWKFDGRRPKAKKATGMCMSTVAPGEWPLFEYDCPYGQVGDQLWVRETTVKITPSNFNGGMRWLYRADIAVNKIDKLKLVPAIHMPRLASRITLEITEVRVECLQDISNEDCFNEGWEPEPIAQRIEGYLARDWYIKLWGKINGPDSWELNPWVWVIEFKKL